MSEFFSGWRRRVGLLTLLLSVAVMMCLLRSATTRDQFVVAMPYGETFVAISWSGHFSLAIMRARVFGSAETWQVDQTEHARWGCREDEEFDRGWPTAFHLMMGLPRNGISLFGSRFSFYHEARDPNWMIGCLIPYWSWILFLCVFSALLLNCKRCKSTQIKLVETDPAGEP